VSSNSYLFCEIARCQHVLWSSICHHLLIQYVSANVASSWVQWVLIVTCFRNRAVWSVWYLLFVLSDLWASSFLVISIFLSIFLSNWFLSFGFLTYGLSFIFWCLLCFSWSLWSFQSLCLNKVWVSFFFSWSSLMFCSLSHIFDLSESCGQFQAAFWLSQ